MTSTDTRRITAALALAACLLPAEYASAQTPPFIISPANCQMDVSVDLGPLAASFEATFPGQPVPDFNAMFWDIMNLYTATSGLVVNDVGPVADPADPDDNVFSFYVTSDPDASAPLTFLGRRVDDTPATVDIIGRALATDGFVAINKDKVFDQEAHPIFGAVNVRLALAQAFDVERLLDFGANGASSLRTDSPYAGPTDNDLANLYDACPDTYAFSPDTALTLLEEANWADMDNDGIAECTDCDAYLHIGDPGTRLTEIGNGVDWTKEDLFVRSENGPDENVDVTLTDQDGRIIRQWFDVPPSSCATIDECVHEVGPVTGVAWEQVDGKLIYTFTIGEDLAWSDGTPVTADEYQWLLDAQLETRTTPRHVHDNAFLHTRDTVSDTTEQHGITLNVPFQGMFLGLNDPPGLDNINYLPVEAVPGQVAAFGQPGTTQDDIFDPQPGTDYRQLALDLRQALGGESERAQREELYRQAQDLLHEEQPYIFLYNRGLSVSNADGARANAVAPYSMNGSTRLGGSGSWTEGDWYGEALFEDFNLGRSPALLGPSAGEPQPLAFIDETRRTGMDVHIVDLDSGTWQRRIPFLGAAWTTRGNTTLDDYNGNDAFESVVVATRNSDGAIIAQVRDSLTGARLANIYFLGPAFVPWRTGVIEDLNGNGSEEIVVLAIRRSDLAIIVQVRDGQTGALIGNRYYLGGGFRPQRMIVVPDSDGDGVPEIGVLAIRASDGRFVVQLKNVTGPSGTRNLWYLGPDYFPLLMTGAPDSDGDGNPEIAVLAIRLADYRLVVQYRNANGAPSPRNRWYLNGDYVPVRMLPLPDSDGDGIPELAVLAWRANLDGRMVVQVRNTNGPSRPRDLWYFGYSYVPMNLVAYEDTDAGGNVRMGVVARDLVDLKYRMEMRDLRGPAAKQQFLLTE